LGFFLLLFYFWKISTRTLWTIPNDASIQRKKLIFEKGEKKGKKKESPGEKEIGRPHLCSAILPLCSFQPVVSDPLKAAGTFRSIFVLP
jgi:hypothetical protein